jgi:MtN3 and saliva related transmembrane protein
MDMLDPLAPYVGGIAAFLAAFVCAMGPRCVARGSTDDFSFFMLGTLTLGLGLWIIYGSIRANG